MRWVPNVWGEDYLAEVAKAEDQAARDSVSSSRTQALQRAARDQRTEATPIPVEDRSQRRPRSDSEPTPDAWPGPGANCEHQALENISCSATKLAGSRPGFAGPGKKRAYRSLKSLPFPPEELADSTGSGLFAVLPKRVPKRLHKQAQEQDKVNQATSQSDTSDTSLGEQLGLEPPGHISPAMIDAMISRHNRMMAEIFVRIGISIPNGVRSVAICPRHGFARGLPFNKCSCCIAD
eukprot:SAG31_NODE_5_length_43735_cov_42.922266_15_plen_236_part_00